MGGIYISASGLRAKVAAISAMLEAKLIPIADCLGAINAYSGDDSLTGIAYTKSKTYYKGVYDALLTEMREQISDIKKANAQMLSNLASLAPKLGSACSEQVENDIDCLLSEKRDCVEKLEYYYSQMSLYPVFYQVYKPILNWYLSALVIVELRIKEKEDLLRQILAFDASAAGLYDGIGARQSHLALAVSSIRGADGWSEDSKRFIIPPAVITALHAIYESLAEQQYADYLRDNPGTMDKLIAIIQFERTNSGDVEKINRFLDPLEERDTIEIKYIAYSAEEPCRSLWIRYLDRYEIKSVDYTGTANFTSASNGIYINVDSVRVDPRGAYETFFHECGHAVDYYAGIDAGYDSFFSDYYVNETGETLRHLNRQDVTNHISSALERLVDGIDVEDESMKASIRENVLREVLKHDTDVSRLSDVETDIYYSLKEEYASNLKGPDNECPSDIYSGVTNFAIRGSYAHDETYWYKSDGTTIRGTNRECFAEYYGYAMISDETKTGIVQEYLPASYSHLDEMLDAMVGLR